MSAKLIFYHAPMNSGKSAQLQMKAHNYDERGVSYVILKSSIDSRDSDGVIHSRPLGDVKCTIISPKDNLFNTVSTLMEERGKIKYVLVDEAQFLTEKQVDQLTDVVDYLNINVICYGLRTDFKTRLFPGSKRLFEVADSFKEIESTCSCGEKSLYNARIDSNGDVVTEGAQVEVGGEERYMAMCRKCYKEKTKK